MAVVAVIGAGPFLFGAFRWLAASILVSTPATSRSETRIVGHRVRRRRPPPDLRAPADREPAGHCRHSKYVEPTENAQPYLYTPVRQVFDGQTIAVHIRTVDAPELAAGMLRRQVAAIDPTIRVFDPMPMAESITAGRFGEKVAAVLLACLGVFALLLAATGLYSLMLYSVAPAHSGDWYPYGARCEARGRGEAGNAPRHDSHLDRAGDRSCSHPGHHASGGQFASECQRRRSPRFPGRVVFPGRCGAGRQLSARATGHANRPTNDALRCQ